jgi:biotin carboxyl carrier protein
VSKYFVKVEDEDFIITVEGDSLIVEKPGEDGEILSREVISATLDKVHGQESTLNIGAAKQQVALQKLDKHHLQILFPGLPGLSCEIYDELSRALEGESKQQGDLFIKSPMPGVVVALKVEEGDLVAEGAPLLILEAMKTENEICAGREARVKTLHVSAGETIQNGALLIELEETTDE